MARIRSVKPDYWHDRKLARSCSRDARMLYIGLWNQADEWSRCNGDPAVIKGQVFPYDDVDVAALLTELAAARRVLPYEHDGDPFLYLPKLADHQRLDTAKVASKFPEPPADIEDCASSQVTAFSRSSEKTAAESENSAAPSVLLYGTGSMGQGTGDRVGATTSAARTDTQRSKVLTDAYAEAEPMCKWPAVNGVVIKAIRSQKFTDDEIHAALLRLAAEGRGVTVETLRVELTGLPAGRASPSNMEQHAALNRRLEAQFPQGEIA